MYTRCAAERAHPYALRHMTRPQLIKRTRNPRRVRGDAYFELIDELLTAVRQRYGNTTFLQFDDMSFENASKLLNMYRCGMVLVLSPPSPLASSAAPTMSVSCLHLVVRRADLAVPKNKQG